MKQLTLLKPKDCHHGNIPLITTKTATLYAGGWTRGAQPAPGWAVIDLSDEYARRNLGNRPLAPANGAAQTAFAFTLRSNPAHSGPWLDAYIRDFDTPRWPLAVWDDLAIDIGLLLEKGTNVLVACDGGHGRTGLVLAILLAKLAELGVIDPIENPVQWLRENYCPEIIETEAQMEYVARVLGVELENEPNWDEFDSPCKELVPHYRCESCWGDLEQPCTLCGGLCCAYCEGNVCLECQENYPFEE